MSAKSTSPRAARRFDKARIQEAISVLGLNAEHGKLAERIRAEVINGKADAMVKSCFAALARNRGFSLMERNIGIESFKQAWVRRLQCYGQGFDTPEYFSERLETAAAFARGKIPLSILQLQHCLTQQTMVNSLSSIKLAEDAATVQPLVDCILKLTSLELYLAAEGYRLPEIDELQKALDGLRKETSQLHREASTDQLTGMMNYASLMETLEHQINAAHNDRRQDGGNPLCLIMIDLDFFKKINDTYGHVIGDFVLRHVAERIRAAVRDFDKAGRFGGEEFVIIMTNTELELAKVIAERIRKGVMETPLHLKEFTIEVTISLGLAMLKEGERKEALLERADAAMYEAKRAGRNRIMVAKDTDASQALPEL
ncbi:diguanylate cyclase (GGDEF) domain-containing protein [Nitrosospira sp. Nl5]|uniref:GGDEF domain-containing protein n=1 Tax=Nitrosospira sp. Nl5 TaxID=200120 RepID=UPI000891F5C8|nr:GGDEF domain-containing protein [Nitrosospira sp. Nl5]SCY28260.1 diguanylate cyclase (GGDEF) domain-containing protein [Nitrosospira sp. Nl5]